VSREILLCPGLLSTGRKVGGRRGYAVGARLDQTSVREAKALCGHSTRTRRCTPRRVKGSSLRPFRHDHRELAWLTGQLNLALPAPGGYVDKHVEREQADTLIEVIQTGVRRCSRRRPLTSVDCCAGSCHLSLTTAVLAAPGSVGIVMAICAFEAATDKARHLAITRHRPLKKRLAHLVERRDAGSAARDAERVSSRAAGKGAVLRAPQTRPSTNPHTEALASLRASFRTVPVLAHCLEGGDSAQCSV
jgi:hypothetical protein